MSHIDRPARISAILATIGAGEASEINDEYESHIVDLDAQQPNWPAHIAEILRRIGAQYPADIEGSLETYISGLELGQHPIQPDANYQSWGLLNNPPISSGRRHYYEALETLSNADPNLICASSEAMSDPQMQLASNEYREHIIEVDIVGKVVDTQTITKICHHS